jgi:hypothetical protein
MLQVHTIPLFVLYLVLLMHNYFLGLVSPRPGPRAPTQLSELDRRGSLPHALPTMGAPLAAAVAQAVAACAAGLVQTGRYMRALCCDRSLSPHCLLLHIEVRS